MGSLPSTKLSYYSIARRYSNA
nr:unnamed protein product [Callosobruchus analis]